MITLKICAEELILSVLWKMTPVRGSKHGSLKIY
jgi:hypothetical protein